MEPLDLRVTLRAELARRQGRNRRYSLRAFARALGTHHSTLSQILARRRRLTPRTVRRLGGRLGLSPAQVADACLRESCDAVQAVVGDPRFRPDSRWIATMTGLPLDDVNVALHRLLHERRLAMRTPTVWTITDTTTGA